jgi:citrate synthase
MVREKVESTSLASVGYDAETQVLEVEFHSGSIYQYLNVPVEVYNELMAAESHGSYFANFIRNNYQFRQIK